MSLKNIKDHIQKLADSLVTAAQNKSHEELKVEAYRVAGMLCGIVISLPDDLETPPALEASPLSVPGLGVFTHKEQAFSHQALMAKAREEAAQARRMAKAHDTLEPNLVTCEDGPEAGTAVPLSPQMGVGNYVSVGGERYALTEKGTLKHSPMKKE